MVRLLTINYQELNMQLRKKFKTASIVLSGSFLLGATSYANPTTEQLQTIAEQTAVLEAQLKQLKLEEEISKLKTQAAERSLQSSTVTKTRFTPAADPMLDMGLPSIIQVEGVKGALEAVLAYPGNIRQRVKEGDVISGKTISKISVNEVVLNDNKTKAIHRLSFSTNPVTKDASSIVPGAPLPMGIPSVSAGGAMIK